MEALRLARAAGMHVSVDPASASLLADVGPRQFLEWTRGVNYCFPNLEEGQLLGGASQPLAVMRALLLSYDEVVLKLGAGGALWASATATKLLSLPAEPATVVDTTGAGDAFCAGFLAQRLRGAPPADALEAGLHLAADAVSRVGARPPLPAPTGGETASSGSL
jgi:sugar/nucleoside kinase (ribokinase family)